MPRKMTDAPATGIGPEQFAHLDHDAAARRASLAGEPARTLDQVKAQVKDVARDYAETAKQWAGDRLDARKEHLDAIAERGRRYVGDVADRGTAEFARRRSAVEDFVSENPALVGGVGLAAGLLIGALLPRTTQEDRTLGPYADEARGQGLRYARDAMHSGRAYVEAAMDQASGAMDRASDGVETGSSRAGMRNGPSGRYQNH